MTENTSATSATDRLVLENEALQRRIAALEADTRRFKATLYGIGDGVISADADGNVVQMNRAAEVLTGWSEIEAKGRPTAEVFKIINEETRSEVDSPVARVLREGVGIGIASGSLLISKDGAERPIADSCAPIRDESGEITGVVVVFSDQSEERKAQRLVREARNYAESIVDTVREPLIVLDADMKLISASRAFYRTYEVTSGDAAGRLLYELGTGQWDIPRLRELLEQILPNSSAFDDFEVEHDFEHIGRRTMLLNARRIYREGNETQMILLAIEDITERKHLERLVERQTQHAAETRQHQATTALQESEQRLGEAQRLGRIGHWELDLETQKISWSDTLFRIYGRDPTLGPPTTEEQAAYHSADDAKRLRECTTRIIETADPYEVDVSVTLPGGRVVDVVTFGSAVKDSRGRVVRLLGMVQDITERKRAEVALRESEKKYRDLFDNAGDAILIADVETAVILDANKAAETLLGRAKHEIIGIKRSEIHPADEASDYREQFHQHVGVGRVTDTESRIVRRHGTIIPVRVSAKVIDLQGRKVVQGVFQDITEHKRMEEEREKLEEQLRASQKLEAIGSLAGGVAHDFNNLISVMLSYTAFALERVRVGDPLRDDLGEVTKAGERAAALTRQLLAFSRKQVLQPVALDLNHVVTGIDKMLRRILGEDIDVLHVLATDLNLTLADPGQIEQVLMNLVVNARDAMPRGGKLTIETSNVEIDAEHAARHVAVNPGSYVQLVVTDTGSGMDEQTCMRIFEPFFTTKEKGKGTGLGLSTVYGIVKQSGGNVWVYSEPGHGTTFKVYLPRELSATTATTSRLTTIPLRISGTETMLVVEDEEALRKIARRALEAAGYTVLTAADGAEALLICAQHVADIHLLVTDVVMPGMGGRALAQEFSKARPTAKVLYMSGYTGDAIAHHGVLDAGTHFLGKPFTAADLTRKVREVLDYGVTNVADGREQAITA